MWSVVSCASLGIPRVRERAGPVYPGRSAEARIANRRPASYVVQRVLHTVPRNVLSRPNCTGPARLVPPPLMERCDELRNILADRSENP